MAEKTIINVIDVSEYGFYQMVYEKPDRYDPCNQWGDTRLIFSSGNPNCDYKQLQRTTAQYIAVVEQNKSLQDELKQKKQECEELKEKISSLEDELNVIQHNCTRGGCKYFDNGNFKIFYNCRAKQALDEIENIVNELHYSTLYFHSGKTHALADRIQKTRNQILDIINKADFRTDTAPISEDIEPTKPERLSGETVRAQRKSKTAKEVNNAG